MPLIFLEHVAHLRPTILMRVFFAAHGMVQQASSPRLYRMDLVVITGFSVWFKFIQYTESST